MARYKPQERNRLLIPVVLCEQIEPGNFAFALDYLVDHELDFTAMALDRARTLPLDTVYPNGYIRACSPFARPKSS